MEINGNINYAAPAVGAPPSACAACKHQRKRCGDDCRLARYFPAERHVEFLAVHKVFGVSNVTKIVNSINDEASKQKAIDSLIWEAFWRQKDPVSGPLGEFERMLDKLIRCQNQIRMLENRNQNPMAQVQGQGEMIYRPAPPPPPPQQQPLMEWNAANNGMNINVAGNDQLVLNNNNNNNENGIANGNGNHLIVDQMDDYGFAAPINVQSPRNLRQESEVGPPQMQNSVNNGFNNQQCCITGQFN